MKLSLGAVAIVGAMTVLAFALPACGAEDAPRRAPARAVAFAEDPPVEPSPGSAVVFLRGRGEAAGDKGSVEVDVVARGAAALHGAALRVTFDPEALAFVSAETSPAWSRKSMGLTKEGTPGQLAIAWFEKGERAIDVSAETVLGTLTFEQRGAKGSAVGFRNARSALVGLEGRALGASFRGGRVLERAASR